MDDDEFNGHRIMETNIKAWEKWTIIPKIYIFLLINERFVQERKTKRKAQKDRLNKKIKGWFGYKVAHREGREYTFSTEKESKMVSFTQFSSDKGIFRERFKGVRTHRKKHIFQKYFFLL